MAIQSLLLSPKLCSRKMTGVFRLAAALLAVLAAGEAISQAYPVRPIRFLVGSPPGSGNDLVSRLLAQKLAERFGQPVIVEQKPGGAGLLANAALGKSPPDGPPLVLLSGAISRERRSRAGPRRRAFARR